MKKFGISNEKEGIFKAIAKTIMNFITKNIGNQFAYKYFNLKKYSLMLDYALVQEQLSPNLNEIPLFG